MDAVIELGHEVHHAVTFVPEQIGDAVDLHVELVVSASAHRDRVSVCLRIALNVGTLARQCGGGLLEQVEQ
ncbi:hypothetical protein D3C87_2144580 [compost metagenome]